MTPLDIATSAKTTIPYEATVCQIIPGNAKKFQADKFQFIEQKTPTDLKNLSALIICLLRNK